MPLVRINRSPSRRELTVFGLAWLVILGFWSGLLWSRGHRLGGEAMAALAAAVPLAGLVVPGLLRRVFVAVSLVTYPIGYVTSYVVLALVYFAVLTPIGLVMRLFGQDPLCRRLDPASVSYWVTRSPARRASDYFRQS